MFRNIKTGCSSHTSPHMATTESDPGFGDRETIGQ